jgi:hypothetical protein
MSEKVLLLINPHLVAWVDPEGEWESGRGGDGRGGDGRGGRGRVGEAGDLLQENLNLKSKI